MRSARAPLKRVRRLLLRKEAAVRAARQRRRRPVAIPVPGPPDPALLLEFPGERDLPPEIRDAQLLADALAWRETALAAPQPEPPPAARTPAARRAATDRPISNVVFVSHCDFTGNSALHVLAVASELHRRGLSPAIAVPGDPDTVEDVGRPPFPVLSYRAVRRGRLRFPDGRGPDLVHAFTPRELVRKLTVDLVRAHGCRYVVHLEDNEDAILSAELGGVDVEALRDLPWPLLDEIVADWQSHPLRSRQLLEHAAGVTVVIDRLLELVPRHLPAAVVRAGFDEAVLSPRREREETRAALGLVADDLALLYTGNVHATNLEEMRELWRAVARLRGEGRRVVLVKTGWSAPEVAEFPDLEDGLRDLGWVPRDAVPELLAAADVLVQPGAPGPFNDYRFPSKLPEFLASGRPVVLPRANVGLELEDGREALVLDRGDAAEIAAAVARLADDPELRRRLGEAGRAFAERELRWARSVDAVVALYGEIAAAARSPAPAWTIEGVDPPVKLVAVVERTPTPEEVRLARAHGIYGFCLDAAGTELPDAPFCFRQESRAEAETDAFGDLLADPRYIRAGGGPLLFAGARRAADGRLRVIDFASAVETGAVIESAQEGAGLMPRRLAVPTPFTRRACRGIATRWLEDLAAYQLRLRKSTLEALLLAAVKEPLMFVDGVPSGDDQKHREAWLAATLFGLRDGLRQASASRRLPLTRTQATAVFRLNPGPLHGMIWPLLYHRRRGG